MPIEARHGESMQALADRQRAIALKQRESAKLQAALDREKQFNRKVQLNAQLRTLTDELGRPVGRIKPRKVTMTKMKMHTPDLTQANIAKLAESVPRLRHRSEG